MIATFQIKPYEADTFFKAFRDSFSVREVKVTVETMTETQAETNIRILQAIEAEKRGELVHTMTVEELAALI
ncbi:hypothetical protein [Treponema endosymbiont of Eucomonympha sp.]|uniref:hypothetical protein n=1 Tax=Treponema endosymbiont of Eucomonympha sp. TaxID=1580831 RepID=UPI000750DB34|nr:hypothetical protein [Treponema endosymbiont of Eucomonympha sp.]